MTLDNLYQFNDPLGDIFDGGLTGGGGGLSLSAWASAPSNSYDSDDYWDDDDEEDDSEDSSRWNCSGATAAQTQPPKQQPAAPTREDSSGSVACPLNSCVRKIRVRFSAQPEVRLFERVAMEHFGTCWYSCHELQRIIDDAKKEKENKNSSDSTAL
ncbi:expressed unknown protein [Seminavis robusta]|uniref:Uncharacterized protein n=1 Tax=Seminavis robusta TaxID=568900 RepID=A0A9N8H4E2_9STRA|nr:expressed unknown protein [Seminavis robusta]|eukprot:Sro47_g027850.1 n/a (156) ;mRNA; r:84456-84923